MIYHKTHKHSSSEEWIVLVHGAGGSSSIWFKNIREYIKHFNVLLVDLRGHGKSKNFFREYLKSEYSFEDVSRDIIEVIDHLKIKSAHFIGISLGTIIVRTIAEIDKSRVKSMIMGGAIIRFNTRSRFLISLANVFKKMLPYMWIYSFYAFILMPRKRHRSSRRFFVNEAYNIGKAEFLRWYRLTAGINPLLNYFNEKEIPIPTLYLMGDEDYMFLPPVEKLVKIHKLSSLNIINNSGHVCNIDQSEIFNRLSVDFVYHNSI